MTAILQEMDTNDNRKGTVFTRLNVVTHCISVQRDVKVNASKFEKE